MVKETKNKENQKGIKELEKTVKLIEEHIKKFEKFIQPIQYDFIQEQLDLYRRLLKNRKDN